MAHSGLLELPAELALLFMTHLETPRDLFACIRASRHFWDIFQANRIALLAAVIGNAAPEGNLAIAIAACKAARVSKLWWSKAPAADVTQSELDFEEMYPRGRALDFHPLRDWDLLVALHKLWWVSDYFMTAFELEARDMVEIHMPRQQHKPKSQMTRSERLRLQRAFFRFEVCRRITPALFSEHELIPDEERDRLVAILKWYPPWEREELLSIQEFLVFFVKRLYRNLQCYIIAEFSKLAKTKTSRLGKLSSFDPFDGQSIEEAFEDNGLNLWNQMLPGRQFQYLVARGLPFIRWLSKLPPKQAISALRRFLPKEHEPSILEELVAESSQIAAHDVAMDWPTDGADGALESPSQGWRWAESHNLTTQDDDTRPPYEPLLKRYTLRSMGYVFWDAARLNGEWGFSYTSPAMLRLRPRRDDDTYDDIEAPSIDDDFDGVMMPEFEKLHDPNTFAWLMPDDEWESKFDGGPPAAFSREERDLFNIEY